MSVDAADAPPPSPLPQHGLALRPGALIHGRFRIGATLGSSAYAFTYSAADEQYGERVVVKEFFPRGLVSRAAENGTVRAHSSADDQEFARAAKRFLREGELLADLSHPTLLRVRRALEENGTAYIVADFHELTPLREHLRAAGGRLPAPRAVETCVRVLEVLELVHAEGALHRDVSPDTVGIDANGRPILVGFPASRHLHNHGGNLTPGFAAIELYGAKGLGPWTDVYSCAALLYFMITGVVPPSAVERAAGQQLTPPGSLAPGLPPMFVSTVLRGLAQLPEQRTHSAGEFARQVLSALHAAGQPATTLPDAPGMAVERTGFAPPALPSIAPTDPGIGSLRLTQAGVVLPEESGITGRVLRWLAERAGRNESEEKARVDAEAAEVLARLNSVGMGGAPADIARSEAPAPLVRAPEPGSRLSPIPLADRPAFRPPVEANPAADTRPAEPARVADREVPPAPVADESLPLESFDLEAFEAEAATIAFSLESLQSRPVSPVFEFETSATDGVDAASASGLLAPDARPNASIEPASSSRLVPALRLPHALHKRSRAATTVGVILLLAAAGVAYAARNQSARRDANTAAPPAAGASRQAAAAAPPADSTSRARVEALSAGNVQQQGGGTAKQESTASNRRPETASSANRTRTESDEPSPGQLSDLRKLALPIATPTGATQLLPPELLIDIRDRLAAGRQLSESGDYVGSRRTLRGAVSRIDSLATQYSVSDALRSLRTDAEKEAQRVLDACLAENEIYRKRGGKLLACQ